MEQMEERVGFSGATRVLVTLASFIVVVAGLRAASSVLVPLLLAAFIAVICTVPLTMLLRIALEGSDDTRWIATMLGPGPSGKPR